jgi:hypothetical protein
MADVHKFNNDRARAANSEVDILGKLDYWRAALHERVPCCGLGHRGGDGPVPARASTK